VNSGAVGSALASAAVARLGAVVVIVLQRRVAASPLCL